MSKGRFLDYGGQYAPETMMAALEELETAYEHFSQDPDFQRELTDLLANYAGRPSLLYYAEKMTKDLGGAKIYLKREDLNHTGAHKINNALGQVLLAKKMGKTPGQLLEKEGLLPDAVLACVGGGSNAIGAFYDFIRDPQVRLIGCEAAGRGDKDVTAIARYKGVELYE